MTSLLLALLVLAACAALTAQLVWWLSNRQEPGREPPPLVIPIHADFRRSAEPRDLASAASAASATSSTLPTSSTLAALSEPPATATETVHFRRPGESALQLLPARLEVVAGTTPRQELRFVRLPGEAPEMILGRDASSSPKQVTLASRTVSRRHARVAFADGRWLVTNLSRTNPVVVNDEALAEFEGARALADGDRIELGDVVLRFCAS